VLVELRAAGALQHPDAIRLGEPDVLAQPHQVVVQQGAGHGPRTQHRQPPEDEHQHPDDQVPADRE